MIIVKDKGKNSKIYIQRTGGDIIPTSNTNTDVDLSNYYTKDEVDELIANMGEEIPYFVVNSDWTGYESGSFDEVRQAIIDKKPYFIYAPAPLGGYFSPNYAKVTFGQIDTHFFYHTDNGTNYYFWVYFHSDSITKNQKTIQYATTSDLSKYGVYGLIVNYNEEYNEYTYNGVEFYGLKQAIENGENQYAIYLPNSDNTYKIAAQEIEVVNDNEIRCITIENNGDTQITTNWTIGFDDDYFEMHIFKGDSTTINIATQEWIEQQGFLTTIPDNVVTEDELEDILNDIDYSLPTITVYQDDSSIEGDIEGVINAIINSEDCNVLYKTGNTIHKSTGFYTTSSNTSVRAYFYYLSDNRMVRRYIDITKNSPHTATISALTYTNAPVDNLTSTSKVFPLSANQGRVLKGLIDGCATEEWVLQQGFLTAIPDEYVTESELETKLEDIDFSLPTLVFTYKPFGYEGDLNNVLKVLNAIQNDKPANVILKKGDTIHITSRYYITSSILRAVFLVYENGGYTEIQCTVNYTTGNSAKDESRRVPTIVNNLTSTSSTSVLSANMGRVLDERITNEIGNINNILENIIG